LEKNFKILARELISAIISLLSIDKTVVSVK